MFGFFLAVRTLDPLTCTRFSQQYRAVLYSCITELQDLVVRTPDDAPVRQELLDQRDLFVIMNLVWHFCEVFFIRSAAIIQTGGYVLRDLVEWVSLHFSFGKRRSPNTTGCLVAATRLAHKTRLLPLCLQSSTLTSRRFPPWARSKAHCFGPV